MEQEVLIKAEGVSKKFCKDLNLGLFYGLQDLGSSVFGSGKNERELRKKEFWAVDDINFEVRRGECLGLLGHNGAGKSTLLKVITGLIAPDRGKITMKGRVNALIELTAGFNPILTGRENIYNNGAVLGLTDKEIRAKYDDIVAFSELEEFIDTPVQYYSSGMKVRLGFSVAAFTEPDVLILDEVLAVGDVGFRTKSFNKTLEIMQKAAVIFVSHSMTDVARTCNQVMFMRHGRSYYHGTNIHKGIDLYLNEFNNSKLGLIETQDGAALSNFVVNNQNINFEKDAKQVVNIPFGDTIQLKFDVALKKDYSEYFAIIRISDKDMKIVGSVYTNRFNGYFKGADQSTISIDLLNTRLINGEYSITYMLAVNKKDNSFQIEEFLTIYRDYVKFKIEGLEFAEFSPVFYEVNTNQVVND
ncbi:ABC transporter ATP-binding protein [Chryseobacterium sp. FH1]|uniref:ABC transporter ATP-binding protein n=1 Tax=Chryseobacterium sp. FH1 TaxID=1233951 RepID=UPI0004E366F2|nr:ABC transporter ATP-binding protein [Chryseobacterium sp. FH1]KFC24062.1 polysialic [Chryseobacterium sp. FH1]